MVDLRPAFGERVRDLRGALRLSQEQLAEAASVDVTYVSAIERGLRNPGLNILARLAGALRVSLPELVSDLRHVRRRPARRGRPRKQASQ